MDVGQKFKSKAWNIWQRFEIIVMEKPKKSFSRVSILNFINLGPFDKTVGPGKKSKINKYRAYIPEFTVYILGDSGVF